MQPAKGYYSLVQYCPDEFRSEAANIGVALLCPDRGFLDVQIADGNERIRTFFGPDSFDVVEVNRAKQALTNRIRGSRDTIANVAEFTKFIETRANGVLMTAPRAVKVCEPAADLQALYEKLVVARRPFAKHERSRLVRRLSAALDQPSIRDRILRKQVVEIPVANTTREAPYAFANGRLNLICPLHVNARLRAEARELALENDLLRKHEREMEIPAAIWVAMATSVDAPFAENVPTVTVLLKDYGIPVYSEDDLDELVQAVEQALH